MKSYIAITDRNWFELLKSQPHLEEVNFWQPSGNRQFRRLSPGELFLFKLHSPDDYIVGGGIFAHSSLLPISLAWDSFGISNGARTFAEMRTLVDRHRRDRRENTEDYMIGCIILEQPFFLPEDLWIPAPANWSPNIVQGNSYDLSIEPGLTLWNQLQAILSSTPAFQENPARYGHPVTVLPRLGQGTFRVVVTDAYTRRCAITMERTLPALDAAHIIPFSENGPNAVNNGILLRRDLHALFDKGYITISPSLEIEVSRKIKEEYENGRDYYRYHGGMILIPSQAANRPSSVYLDWHNTNIYRG